MKKVKKIVFAVFMAALFDAAPLLSYADEPQTSPPEQQTIVAPTDQSTDRQAPPAAPAPHEEGKNTEINKWSS
ncbi:MAG: hypothetical protein WCQ90_06735 [Deltaproteobacteria bacterium]